MKGDLPCSDIAGYSRASVASVGQPNKLGESSPQPTLTLTTMPNGSMPATFPKYQSGETSEPTILPQENVTSLPALSPAQEQAVLENGKDYSIPTQLCGSTGLESVPPSDPDSLSPSSLLELSDADFEQYLEDSEWSAILQNLQSLERQSWERVTLDPDCLSFPTLTSGDRSLHSRPAGQTKCEKWFKDNGLIPPGYQLNAQSMALMMGFPEDWFDCLSPPITQDGSELDISQAEQLPLPKLQSPLEESSTSTVSSSENILRVMKEPDRSTTNPVTVSNPSEHLGERRALLTVEDDQDNPRVTVSNCIKTKRSRGFGTGRIQWRTFTSSSGKEYKQPWYDWQVNEGGKTKTKTKYIPKRLLALVQAKEAASSPVQEVLRVLGVGKHQGESSICPACQQPLPSLERGCGVCGWESSDSISPKKSAEEFFRGNSQTSPPSISPKKKGRGENKIPASGSLVPVVQTRRDKDGRIVEYPRVEGERVHRSAAFDFILSLIRRRGFY